MVGASKGPGVADIMALTGKEETVSRIEKLVKS
jgi:lysyl-tRNA synthetase class I